ncbi:hypothetical protein QBC36DRAFT_320013 [Triangularia setosa]|uniref:Uncharacterized protein n=1 Tax=Triangularia setosa TaxID=2587417 RepID=A0AAN7ACB4_9PEZI|nr:hypothetical protein QBC36DRAFT_320013 [Podospora setosa]
MNHNHSDIIPYPHPPSVTSSPRKKKSGMFPDLTKDINFGENIDLVLGVTATALTADQLLKLKDSKKNKAMHLAKASLSAAAAATAFTMMRREHNERARLGRTRRRSETETRSTPRKNREHESESASSSRSSSRPRTFERTGSRSRSQDRGLLYPDLEAQLEPEDHKVRWALVPSPPSQEERQEERAESPDDYGYASARLASPPDEPCHQNRARTMSPLRRRENDRESERHRHHHQRRKSERQSRWHKFFNLLGQELQKQQRV